MTDYIPNVRTPEPLPSDQPDDLVYLDAYILEIARRLLVGDWTIITPREFCEEGYYAQVSMTSGKRVATIRFCSFFARLSREEQRHTVIHELIHLHLNAMEETLSAVSPRLATDVYLITQHVFNRHLEEATDQLATVIAPAMPLPPDRPVAPNG